MRASRANLVVVLGGKERETSGEALLDRLLPTITSIYPARLLIVRLGAGTEPGALRGSVSALCTLGGGARYICCEKIAIDAGQGAEQSIPGSVLSLILGELPVVIWTPGEVPHADSWFRLLLLSTDRLVIDSSRFPSPSDAFRELARLTEDFRRVPLADFEWTRLAPWRRAIASAFDPPAARQAALEGIERVTFLESPRPGRTRPRGQAPQGILADEPPPEASASAASLLLKAWMAKHAAVRAFAWAPSGRDGESGDPAARAPVGAPTPPPPGARPLAGAPGDQSAAAAAWDPGRGIRCVRFEGRASGVAFMLEVPAPDEGEPAAEEFVMLMGGQPDNPLVA